MKRTENLLSVFLHTDTNCPCKRAMYPVQGENGIWCGIVGETIGFSFWGNRVRPSQSYVFADRKRVDKGVNG